MEVPMVPAQTLYRRFKKAFRPMLPTDPARTDVDSLIVLRSQVFSRLGLPTTRHNVERLILCAASGLSFRVFVRDLDYFFPQGLVADEALFLIAFAEHCRMRHAHTARARRYEAEALLGLPHDGHASPAIDGWLAGLLPYSALRLNLRQETAAA